MKQRSMQLVALPGRVGTHLVILLLCVVWILPLVEGVVTSLRTLEDAFEVGWWGVFTDQRITFDNYAAAWGQAQMGGALLNSLLITLPANAVLVSVSAIVAYTFAQMEFLGRRTTFAIIVALMLIPPQITLVPVLKLFNWIGVNGTLPAMWIYQGGYTMPLGIFILVAFFQNLPKELVEAAEVDGATPLQAFVRVALPLARPGLLSVFILHFLFSWNDLLTPLVFLPPEAAPLTVRVAALLQTSSTDPLVVVSAAAVIAIALPMTLFFTLQRFLARGLTAGAVKG
ncbi:MAG TPA: carbohydrate ABC transporter permease [Acidimicrobiia bacterium]